MLLIQKISADPYQTQTLLLQDGSSVVLTLVFIPMQFGWFIKELIYGSFVLQGLRITNQPNMLHQWQNKLPFGLGCFSEANREPSQAEDFVSGASKLYILTQDECEEYSELITSG